jgi:hypothetical protein
MCRLLTTQLYETDSFHSTYVKCVSLHTRFDLRKVIISVDTNACSSFTSVPTLTCLPCTVTRFKLSQLTAWRPKLQVQTSTAITCLLTQHVSPNSDNSRMFYCTRYGRSQLSVSLHIRHQITEQLHAKTPRGPGDDISEGQIFSQPTVLIMSAAHDPSSSAWFLSCQ